MNNATWTDDFLDKKRQEGDTWYDKYIKVILDVSFLDDHKGIFADWVGSQSRLIAEGTQIADTLPEEGDLTAATIEKIDKLRARQTKQDEELGQWGSWGKHMWPQEFQFHIESTRLATLMACKSLANRQLVTALSAMKCALANAAQLERRYEQLLAKIHSQPDLQERMGSDNQADYTRLLRMSDAMREVPNLFVCNRALLRAQFMAYPESLNDNFTPGACPKWADEKKLATGVRIWQEHMLGCELVLFTHSLPACYLDKKGVPMLYRTERLESQMFLAQRMYETAFMLKDVMDEGGLTILSDTGAGRTAWFAAAVHKVRSDLRFQFGRYLNPEWTDAQGKHYTYKELFENGAIRQEFLTLEQQGVDPGDYSARELGCPSFEWLFRDCLRHDVNFRVRHLWGRGALAATKVRYIHAQMRYFARERGSHYDVKNNGQPINQEDLAYVLLTFGYVIPMGLENLGAILNREEKEAFLHCWKIVGYIMGIDDDLLTDDLEEAKELYEKIKNRQQGHSVAGEKLTSALCTLVTNLLPAWLPFRDAIAPVLIRDQMGADADILFDATAKERSRNCVIRVCWALAKHFLLRSYFLSRYWFFDRIPFTRAGLDKNLQFFGTALVQGLQQAYARQRLDLTSHEKGFTPIPGTTPAEHKKRAVTRAGTFAWVVVGLGLILLFHPFFWIGAASVVVSHVSSAPWLVSATNAIFWVCFWCCFIGLLGPVIAERKVRKSLDELALQVKTIYLL